MSTTEHSQSDRAPASEPPPDHWGDGPAAYEPGHAPRASNDRTPPQDNAAEQSVRASERMSQIEATHAVIDRRSQRSLQHIGLVRFNPFDDTGSDQSFAIALLDDRRDGPHDARTRARRDRLRP